MNQTAGTKIDRHRSDPWDRVRWAYRELLGDADPAGPLVAEFGAVDLRPGPPRIPDPCHGPVVISGPDDLHELRDAVERVTGAATWPLRTSIDLDGTLCRSRIAVARPAAPMAFVACLESMLVDRAQAWRTFKTAREVIASAVANLSYITTQALIIDPRL